MRLNVFKNIRLSLQLYVLVAITLAIATGLIFYAMQQVRSTQGTLKHTIDNRMVSGQSIQGVADALSLSLEASQDVIEKKQTAIDAHDQLKKAIDKARSDWDNYFLGEMIAEEQDLADETTPMLDAAYSKIDRLLKKLETNELADLASWRNETLRPALVDGVTQSEETDRHAADRGQPRPRQCQQELPAGGAQQRRADVGRRILAMLLAWIIIRSAMKKLGADPGVAAQVARRVASGDLQFEMEARRHDATSLMGALRQMKDSLLLSKLDYQGQINAIAKVQGVIECSLEGQVDNANDIFLNLLGYSLEEVKGKNYSMFVDAAAMDSAAYQGLWQALQRGESRQGEFRVVARDKREIWFQGVFNPIVDASGKPFKVVAYLNDVTKQRQEAVLNAAFRGALDRLDANVMVADNDLKIIFVNPAAARMLARAQEVVPQGPAELRRRQVARHQPGLDDARARRAARRDRTADGYRDAPGSDRRSHDEDVHEPDEGRHRPPSRHGARMVRPYAGSGHRIRTARDHRGSDGRQSRESHLAGRQTRLLPDVVRRHQRAGGCDRDRGRRSARRGGRGQPGRPDPPHRNATARPGCWCRSAPVSTTSPALCRPWCRR